MKKIVGILAGAALLATSVFAADVNAQVQLDGDLFNLATGDKTVAKGIMLKEYDPSGTSDYLWKLSVSGDNFGAEIWSYDISGKVSEKKIWFKPADAVKVTVGNLDNCSIANPQFGWWAKTIDLASYGYQGDFTVDALSIAAAICPGAGAYWFDSSAEGYAKLGKFWLGATYDLGDPGKIQAMIAKGATVGAHGFSNWSGSDLAIGVAYAKMPYLQTGIHADVVLSMHTKDDKLAFQGVDSQIGGQFAMDGLLIQETNLIQYRDFNGKAKDGKGFYYGFELKVSYKIDNITPYLQIDGYSIMDKSLTPHLGVSTSVGSVSMYAEIQAPIAFEGYHFNFNVPVQFSVAF